MSYLIVIDSCGELTDDMKASGHFVSAPLTLDIDQYHFVDDETFDQLEFLKRVKESPNCPKSACPSPEYYRKYFEQDYDHIYAITLSANFKAFVATALKIKPICSSTPEGEIQQAGQARGINRALVKMVEMAAESAEHMEDKEIAVSHVNNPERGQMVLDAIRDRVKAKNSFVVNGRGVTSLYASDGGIIMVL